MTEAERKLVHEALAHLGVQRLFLGVFDPAFPAAPGEDLGRGSPYTRGGEELLAFARDLGFNGVQLGPQGMVSLANPSPYDGALFSRNPLNLAPGRLADQGLLPRETLESLAAGTPASSARRADHGHAYRAQAQALDEVFRTHQRTPLVLKASLDAFWKKNASWLLPDSLYDCLSEEHGGGWHGEWGASERGRLDQKLFASPEGLEAARTRLAELRARHAEAAERYAVFQVLLQRQHEVLRAIAGALGLALYGDLQVGASPRDVWANEWLYLQGYRMGAPPSRTTPEGQPWNYRVLDPDLYQTPEGARGPALTYFLSRARRLLGDYDGIRIDHPHGLVCPWVYRAEAKDPFEAVRAGARLFSSPDAAAHPELRKYALVRPDQLDRSLPPHADRWERTLEPEQVDRFTRLFDVLVETAKGQGHEVDSLVAEVLSTLPFPLEKVLERHKLGRFRVTQKANLSDPNDVYRSENARPGDWMMLGNHDTPTFWSVAEAKRAKGTLEAHAGYLAGRLAKEGRPREELARALFADTGLFVQAAFADLLASRAGNVLVFFNDLFGLKEPFNVPGTFSDSNWSLRVPPDFRQRYPKERGQNLALSLPRALAMALAAPGHAAPRRGLVAALERL